MRVLIATPLYPPDIGGPAVFAHTLNTELPKRGTPVTVLNFSSFMRYPKGIRHVAYFWKVFNAAHDHDVILALDPLGVGIPALLAARFAQRRFLLRMVGDRAWETAIQRYGEKRPMHEFSKHWSGKPYLIAIRIAQKITAGWAETIIVPSEYLRGVVSNWGVSKEKIVIIQNSFEKEGLLPARAQARENLKATGKIIISSGRLVAWKGFATLVDIMPDIMDEVPGAVLWIAGEGPERGRLEGLIEKHKLHGRVVLLGNLPKHDLFERLAASDVFVLNTFYEGFSHQILEVMAIGTPVVTTTSGGNPELLAHEREGILVSYDDREGIKDAIKRMLTDEAFARSSADRAKEKAESFSVDRMMEGVIGVLH